MEDIRVNGSEAKYLPTANQIVTYIIPKTQPGDILCVLSNGGFDNIHQKLLDKLN
jgi:UDP-N-acetylmuramate: L-alanyl-gamma-D-glutamyl-meso-diaminopimelate ligase